jgi:hypothetical protein
MKSKIGIYWYFEDKLIVYSENASSVKSVEGFADVEMSHDEVWETVKLKYSNLRTYEYEEIPRGRIVMNSESNEFIVYGSRKVIENSSFRKLVSREFQLDEGQTRFKQDFHYEDPEEINWE